MTAGGRRLRFRTLVVAGNKNGKVGIGIAKGKDVQQAIEKANKKAQKSMVSIPIVEGGTILHEIKAKHGAAVVLLKPQTEGRGLVAGGTVRTICSLAGIENISGKIIGNTRSKLNNAKATMEALQRLKPSGGGEASVDSAKEKEEDGETPKEEQGKNTEKKSAVKKKTGEKTEKKETKTSPKTETKRKKNVSEKDKKEEK